MKSQPGRLAKIIMEAMENRTLFSTVAPTPPPPPPPPPKPGVSLNKGVLSIVGNPKLANTITVDLSKDGKSIDVTYDGKSSSYKLSDVKDVKVADANPGDKVSVDLAGLAPKKLPPPPVAPKGVALNKGLLTIAGDPTKSNTVDIAVSKDGKSVDVTLDGKTSVFSAKSIANISVFDGQKNDAVTVALGGLKLQNPVLVHGGFGDDTIDGGGVNYDLPLAPPPPPPPPISAT